MSIGSDTHKIFKGQCFVVPAGQVFSFRHRDINKGYLCNFHDDSVIGKFGKNALLKDFEFLKPWANPCITLQPASAKHVEQLFRRILQEYKQHGLTHRDIIQSNFIALLCELKEAHTTVARATQTQAAQLTNRFKELLFKNLRTHHRVSDYAAFLNISPNHLNKAVKAVTGKSPTKWIDEAIVLEAKVLLHQSDLSIAAIAEDVGFLDPSYFTRLFKKHEGLTPVAFRKRIEKS
nr:AraC family transcriptional regulator [Chryseolinea lacunae]